MANGDIKAIAVNSNGWSLSVTVEGLSTGGTYDFGMAAGNDPSSASISLNLTSEAYDNTGSATTTSRTIYAIPDRNLGAIRKADPNEATADEAVSGSDVIIQVALTEFVYSGCTAITADFAAGWYTESGTPSSAGSGISVTNNSTLTHPKVIGNWLETQKEIVTADFNLEFFAVHRSSTNGKPCAAVKFTVTDEHAHSVTVTETSLKQSTRPDPNEVSCYIATIDTSSFTDGDLLTCQVQAYPWIGDAGSVLNTNDGTNSFPTPLYTNLTLRLYKSGQFGHTCVDPTSGNDGTGAVYSSQVLAEAGNAYQTIAAALTALQSYHNSNFSRNHAGGGYIYCTEDDIPINTANGGTLTEYVTITKKSTATKANVNVIPGTTNATIPTYLKLKDVKITTGSQYWRPTPSKYFTLNSCTMVESGTTLTFWDFSYGTSVFCAGMQARDFDQFSTNPANWALIRGYDGTSSHASRGWTVIGCNNVTVATRSNTGIPLNDNGIYAFNTHLDTAYTGFVFEYGGISGATGENIVHGVAIINNVIQRVGSQVTPLNYISGDGTVTTTNHMIMWYNTFAGARSNLFYNDIAAGGPYLQTNQAVKNNIFSNYNNKDDTFGNNASATGSWACGYGVGYVSNHFRTSANDEWFGETSGLYFTKGTNAVPLAPGFVDDGSADGGDDGVSDYHIQTGTALETASKDLVYLYDIEGDQRVLNGTIGAYENIAAPTPTTSINTDRKIKICLSLGL